jgi:hypothetical protein
VTMPKMDPGRLLHHPDHKRQRHHPLPKRPKSDLLSSSLNTLDLRVTMIVSVS